MPSTSTKRSHKHSSSSSKSKKSKKSREFLSSDSDVASANDVSEEDQESGEWVVEKVVGKRFRSGQTEYFIKWKDWPSSTNTWEPLSNLTNCPQLVEQYEESISSEKKKNQEVPAGPNGFDKGWKPLGVRGVAPFDFSTSREVFYMVEWEDNEALEKVSSKVVREKIPQKLIRYLEGKIRWKKAPASTNNGDSDSKRKDKKERPNITRVSTSPDSSRKSRDTDSSDDTKKSNKSGRRNGNGSSSGSSSGSDSS